MEARGLPKNIIKFSKREFIEKKPVALKVLKVKSEFIFSIDEPIKRMSVSIVQEPSYLVMNDYGDQDRLYYFSKRGEQLGAEIFKKTPKFLKNLTKKTKIKYQLPI